MVSQSIKQELFQNAVKTGDVEKMKKLLKRGWFSKPADVNKTDSIGIVPLIDAMSKIDVLNCLLDNGADPYFIYAPDSPEKGFSILTYFAIFRWTEGVQRMCSVMDMNKSHRPEYTLAAAASGGKYEIAKAILDWGVSPNVMNEDYALDDGEEGVPVVSNAVRYGHVHILELFDEYGADFHMTGKDGTTLPGYITRCNNHNKQLAVAQFLYDKGIEIDIPNDSGITPLMNAAKDNNVALARFFIERGAQIDAVDTEGNTVLMYAVKHVNPEMVDFLMEHMPDINAENDMGETAYDLAQDSFNDPQPVFKKDDTDEVKKEKTKEVKRKSRKILKILTNHGGGSIVEKPNKNVIKSYKPDDLSQTVADKDGDELVDMVESNRYFLKQLVQTGIILEALQKMTYEQTSLVYGKAEDKMTPELKDKAREIVRHKRAERTD